MSMRSSILLSCNCMYIIKTRLNKIIPQKTTSKETVISILLTRSLLYCITENSFFRRNTLVYHTTSRFYSYFNISHVTQRTASACTQAGNTLKLWGIRYDCTSLNFRSSHLLSWLSSTTDQYCIC